MALPLLKEGVAYQQIDTPQGKIIFEIGKREALEKFGVPASADEEAWHYLLPEEFFVYFPSAQSISLFPRESQVALFVPLEFKVLASSPDLEIKDVTSAAEIIFSQPQSFIPGDNGTVIPKEAGNYIILAKYKNIFSNPCYLTVKENPEKGMRKEKMLCIDILPYKPEILSGEKLQFKAFGTFLDLSNNKYFVKEINYGADWFLQDEERKTNFRNGLIEFSSGGKFTLFCRYNNLQSYGQECVVRKQALPQKEMLKHITLLPSLAVVFSGNSVTLRAFGTYYNNKVEEITDQVSWKVSRKDLLKQIAPPTKKEALFLSESTGVASVFAELDNIKSLPAKIIVVAATEEARKGDSSPLPSGFYQDKKEAISLNDLTREIKNNAEKLNDAFFGKNRKLSAIKINPDFLSISLGEEAQMSALGLYSDNSQEDLTFIGNWVSSDERIASAAGGKVSSFLSGEVKLYLKFRGMASPPAKVIIEPAKLISIILSPLDSKILMGDKLTLKAEGVYTDSSRQDISSLVDWKIAPPGFIQIKAGKVNPIWFGSIKVRAQYRGVKSLPVNIEVVFNPGWLINILLKAISLVILGVITTFIIFFILAERAKNKLKKLYFTDQRKFIINLYENLRIITGLFGLSNEENLPPLLYAGLAEREYRIEGNILWKFTEKFEKAKYSRHALKIEDAKNALDDYNYFLKILFSRYNKFFLFCKYCLALKRRLSLVILKT